MKILEIILVCIALYLLCTYYKIENFDNVSGFTTTGKFKIKNRLDNLCLDQHIGGYDNLVVMRPCVSDARQTWSVNNDGNIRNSKSAQCLDRHTGPVTIINNVNDVSAVTRTCNSGPTRQWRIDAESRLVNSFDDQCLDRNQDPNGSANGAAVMRTCGVRSGLHWYAVPVDDQNNEIHLQALPSSSGTGTNPTNASGNTPLVPPVTPDTPDIPVTPDTPETGLSTGAKIGIGIGAIAFLIILGLIMYALEKREKKKIHARQIRESHQPYEEY